MSSITELPVENLQYLYELAINECVVTDMSYAFELLGHIKTIDLSYIDTSSVTNMSYMFFEDSDLETVEKVYWILRIVSIIATCSLDVYRLKRLLFIYLIRLLKNSLFPNPRSETM